MHTQITCPRCQTPYTAEVHQVVDVGQQPELKQQLMSGQLNVAVCPNCGAAGQLTTPLVYHDPDHDLFMIYVPMELNLGTMEREQLIGELTRQAMNNIPQEQRRAYLLQPQMIINMQTFMEKVLETEGITPEMIARQKKQAELLRTLMSTGDKEVIETLVQERSDEIDETFFAMLKQSIEIASQSGSEQDTLRLINLQAKLYKDTEIGRKLEAQQKVLHAFTRQAKKEGLSPALLAEHIIANYEDDAIVSNLAMAGQQAMTYDFFTLLSDEVEKRRQAGDAAAADKLGEIRDGLLDAQREMQEQSQQVVRAADDLIQQLLEADDQEQAIRDHLDEVDDMFMYVLEARMAQAEQRRNPDEVRALEQIRQRVQDEIEKQMPPEILLLNQLVRSQSEAEQEQLLAQNEHLVTPEMMQLLKAVENQVKASGQEELNGRIRRLQEMVEARL